MILQPCYTEENDNGYQKLKIIREIKCNNENYTFTNRTTLEG